MTLALIVNTFMIIVASIPRPSITQNVEENKFHWPRINLNFKKKNKNKPSTKFVKNYDQT